VRRSPDDRSEGGGSRAQGLHFLFAQNEDFAQDLLAGLEVGGFEPYLDKHDIAGLEELEARLGWLIEAADNYHLRHFADAVASERFGWEVERTMVAPQVLSTGTDVNGLFTNDG
jgi:hypothetical protein